MSEKSETNTAHPDDLAVDRFAATMKAKLAQKRAEGRGCGGTGRTHPDEPVAFLRDVGSAADPCYVPAANGDPGAFAVYRATTLRSQLSGMTDEASSWQPIETARKVVDETVLLRVEHVNYAIAAAEDKHRWEEVCSAYWTDFNSGGWVWHGLAGSPTHWMPIPPLGAHP